MRRFWRPVRLSEQSIIYGKNISLLYYMKHTLNFAVNSKKSSEQQKNPAGGNLPPSVQTQFKLAN